MTVLEKKENLGKGTCIGLVALALGQVSEACAEDEYVSPTAALSAWDNCYIQVDAADGVSNFLPQPGRSHGG